MIAFDYKKRSKKFHERYCCNPFLEKLVCLHWLHADLFWYLLLSFICQQYIEYNSTEVILTTATGHSFWCITLEELWLLYVFKYLQSVLFVWMFMFLLCSLICHCFILCVCVCIIQTLSWEHTLMTQYTSPTHFFRNQAGHY